MSECPSTSLFIQLHRFLAIVHEHRLLTDPVLVLDVFWQRIPLDDDGFAQAPDALFHQVRQAFVLEA